MKGFTFRLQRVLDHRKRIEDEKKLSFVQSRNSYLKELEGLNRIKSQLEESVSHKMIYSSASEYIIAYNYILLLQNRIVEQKKVVNAKKSEMELKKAQFEDSRKDRRIIEKLREKSFREYSVSQDRLEQKQNDEFALYGYVRKWMETERR